VSNNNLVCENMIIGNTDIKMRRREVNILD